MASTTSPHYRGLLRQRLGEAASVLLDDATSSLADAADIDGGELRLLETLVAAVRETPGDGRLWLLFTAVAGAYPTTRQLDELRRRLDVVSPAAAVGVLLELSEDTAGRKGDWDRPLRIVRGGTLVDVNFCAKFVHNTGIQRVVRELMPHFIQRAGSQKLDLVAWTRQNGLTRSLSAIELQRVVDWRALSAGTSQLPDEPVDELLVPWHGDLLLPEVPEPELCEALACLAEHSGTRVTVIGYDTIPISSADLISGRESERFAHYLTVVKHAVRVLAISESVAGEFRGFTSTLPAQGLTGPEIVSVPLAADVPSAVAPDATSDELPLVLCVGSHEPRKNQDAVLFAVETLLREGLRFRVVFVGGGSRSVTLPFDRHLMKLRKTKGFDVESARGLRDNDLWSLYANARFTVLTSLHEGYGLPVVESLALNTPVLTSNYGSLAEIGESGGCVMVNPRDDDEIIEAMRRMLTDDALMATLQQQIGDLPVRTWADYAAELWTESRLETAR